MIPAPCQGGSGAFNSKERKEREENPGARENQLDYPAHGENPWMFHDKWWTPLVVASIAERPGAKASPTRLGPATAIDALPSGVIFTMPRCPASDAATYRLPSTSKASPCGRPRPR